MAPGILNLCHYAINSCKKSQTTYNNQPKAYATDTMSLSLDIRHCVKLDKIELSASPQLAKGISTA
jgi:hypothetical protein